MLDDTFGSPWYSTNQATGADEIDGTGNSLANILTGNGANNTLDGSAGADSMIGARGNDTYIVDNAGGRVIEKVNEGIDGCL